MKVIGLAVLLLLVSVWEVYAAPLSFTCSEPLPEFTLGENSRPTERQIADLCSCVWGKLPSSMKDVASGIKRGEQPSASSIQAFIGDFDKSIRSCGGDQL
jgi:hypothetical protein